MKIIFKIPGISFKLKVRDSLIDEVAEAVGEKVKAKEKAIHQAKQINGILSSMLQDLCARETAGVKIEEATDEDPKPQFRTRELVPRKKVSNRKKLTFQKWTDAETKIMVENLNLKPKELYAKFPELRKHTVLALSIRKSAIVRKDWKNVTKSVKKIYEEHIKSKQAAQSSTDQQS